MSARFTGWPLAVATLACGVWTSDAAAQLVTTQAVGGTGGTAFSLRCPTNMALIGIRGKSGIVVDSIRGVCSVLNSGGWPTGTPVETGSAGGTDGGSYERLCPTGNVVAGFKAESGTVVNALTLQCMIANSSGLVSGAISTPPGGPVGVAGSPGTTAATVICPDKRLGVGFVGRAGAVIDRLALACNAVPVMASGFDTVKFNDPAGVSGTAEMGTIVLNGYAPSPVTVTLRLLSGSSVFGSSVNPASLTIPAGASNAAFQLSSPATVAGCAFVEAGAFNAWRTAQIVMTPPPPSDAGFSFALLNAPANLTYAVGLLNPATDINARISVGTVTRPVFLAAPATFRLSSSSSSISVPTTVTIPKGGSSVNFTARASGGACAVITATASSGKAIRRVVMVTDTSGGARIP